MLRPALQHGPTLCPRLIWIIFSESLGNSHALVASPIFHAGVDRFGHDPQDIPLSKDVRGDSSIIAINGEDKIGFNFERVMSEALRLGVACVVALGLATRVAPVCDVSRRPQVVSHLMNKKEGDGGDGTLKVMCYDSAGWVRDNFKARVDKHNEVGLSNTVVSARSPYKQRQFVVSGQQSSQIQLGSRNNNICSKGPRVGLHSPSVAFRMLRGGLLAPE